MGRTKKDAAAPEPVQEPRDEAEMSMDTPEANTASEGVLDGQEMLGPDAAAELLGCQDDPPLQFTVTAEGGLNLREAPGLDAAILGTLPWGVGVFETGQVCGDWWEVTTGRLTGWVMSEHLEPMYGS